MTHQPSQRCCEPAGPCIDRRTLFALCGGAAASAMFPLSAAVAGPFEAEEFEKLIPADKKFSREWLDSLVARGKPETFSGSDLKYIGMPIGGIGAGCLYLGGDGRLWLWDVFNQVAEGVGNKTATYKGQAIGPRDGALYVEPLDQLRPVDQGFAIRLKSSAEEKTIPLDRNGFSDVAFTGEYPIATVAYRDASLPVTAELEAFSPFLPLNADDSSLPATVMNFTLKNISDKPVEATLAGWLENAVCLQHRDLPGTRRNRIANESGYTLLECSAASVEGHESIDSLPDFGTMSLALLGEPAESNNNGSDAFDFSDTGGKPAEGKLSDKLVGTLGRTVELKPGEAATFTFVVTWHFPNLTLLESLKGRHYAARFANAPAVAEYVAKNYERLASTTRSWRDAWYDSTLPYWFLNRTFANTSILATSTCYRLHDGRFWAWEGVGCCPGTCTHVWHYAQAMGRIFPELERDVRERVDFSLGFNEETGVIRFRGEFDDRFAVDGQCGTILRAYREHQMSADSAFLKRNWPRVKHAMQAVMQRDKDRTGIIFGPMHNTLDADWYGAVPWLIGMYHAALRAAEEMSREVGDEAFAAECRAIFESGVVALDKKTWRDEYGYYIHIGDNEHPNEVGSYEGCHIDQVLGQAWAWQVSLGRVMNEPHVKQALRSLWKFSVTPDVGPYRRANEPGRWYAMPGDGGLLMVTFPYGKPQQVTGEGAWSAMYFNECMSGFEWQVAAHMIWEGMTTKGLAVARLIHDRYHPRLRNPYNEIECGDHYARAMASYGAYLAACGFGYHGPKGHISFSPRLTPENFKAAFTAAEGWGTFAQTRQEGKLAATLAPKYGFVRLKTFGLELPAGATAAQVTATIDGTATPTSLEQRGSGVIVAFNPEIRVAAGQSLRLVISYSG